MLRQIAVLSVIVAANTALLITSADALDLVLNKRNQDGNQLITIQSRESRDLVINKVVANRGNCQVLSEPEHLKQAYRRIGMNVGANQDEFRHLLMLRGVNPRELSDPLRFGEQIILISNCNVLELQIESNLGSNTFSWKD